MKGKKPSFTHNSTGYGKSRQNTQKQRGGGGRAAAQDASKDTVEKNKLLLNNPEDDKDLNSGFGEYMRSPEAVEMMKLFVFANSIMLILTMAWPNLKEQYYMLMHWFNSFQQV